MKSPKPAHKTTNVIADVQNSADIRRIPIDKVGIKDIRHPVRVQDRNGGEQHTIATFNMYVNLPHNFKGTHMSRFVEILNRHEREITVESFREMLSEMTERLEADSGHIEMNFRYFVNKAAPVSGVESLLDYDVSLIGEIIDGKTKMNVKVVVPVTSLAPAPRRFLTTARTISAPTLQSVPKRRALSGSRILSTWWRVKHPANSMAC